MISTSELKLIRHGRSVLQGKRWVFLNISETAQQSIDISGGFDKYRVGVRPSNKIFRKHNKKRKQHNHIFFRKRKSRRWNFSQQITHQT